MQVLNELRHDNRTQRERAALLEAAVTSVRGGERGGASSPQGRPNLGAAAALLHNERHSACAGPCSVAITGCRNTTCNDARPASSSGVSQRAARSAHPQRSSSAVVGQLRSSPLATTAAQPPDARSHSPAHRDRGHVFGSLSASAAEMQGRSVRDALDRTPLASGRSRRCIGPRARSTDIGPLDADGLLSLLDAPRTLEGAGGRSTTSVRRHSTPAPDLPQRTRPGLAEDFERGKRKSEWRQTHCRRSPIGSQRPSVEAVQRHTWAAGFRNRSASMPSHPRAAAPSSPPRWLHSQGTGMSIDCAHVQQQVAQVAADIDARDAVMVTTHVSMHACHVHAK